MRRIGKAVIAFVVAACMLVGFPVRVQAQVEVNAPSAILLEGSTGTVIYEKNADERRSPASITKIMTLLLTFEKIEEGKIALTDTVVTSTYASSMGGSQVFLAAGEEQSLETMIKCIAVSSGNDASVAVAEHISGTEEAFVALMNEKAAELGMENTRFEDCCGLSNSDEHYTTARDVAIMSRELITKYPEIYDYSKIWMEDIIHVTKQGEIPFTLSSTNKLLKQYPYATGLKTGSTDKAKYCFAGTANKDGMDMIAVIMGAEDYKSRFSEAESLLSYGFSVCDIYEDSHPEQLIPLMVVNGKQEFVKLKFGNAFRYVETGGQDLSQMEKELVLPQEVQAPIKAGDIAGEMVYRLGDRVIGSSAIYFAEDVELATYKDYLLKVLDYLLL
ncbi:MAG: D-alanyl-D-alanine carboxypeptidase [Lachnospiraceae bacterium]|nr:D-alanyl-D-alanine carboxypeptidase [Lachnospiraceae bacterium]